MKSAWIKLSLLASVAGFAAMSQANFAQEIKIDRAVNSPTITVRYTKMKAALAELRLNGRSIATRELNGQANGETNFSVDPELLSEGKNDLEVLLFDVDGKLVGTQRAVVTAERDVQGSVYVELPTAGSTVRGTVEMKLGINRDFREMYVSFFVDEEWKALRNFPPYSFFWDTTRLPNGWHEIQAWVVDEANTTHKTRKVRVFVNNPGGRTDRVPTAVPGPGKPADVAPSVNPRQTPVSGDRGLRPLTPNSTPSLPVSPSTVTPRRPSNLVPTVNPSAPVIADASAGLRTIQSDGQPVTTRPAPAVKTPVTRQVTSSAVRPPLAAPAGLKSNPTATPTASGLRTLTPTGQRTVLAQATRPAVPTISSLRGTQQAAQTVLITRGARIPNVGNLTVLIAGRIVDFDVTPRISDGIPLAPIRHILEQSGGQVGWNNLSKTVTAKANGSQLSLQMGKATATVGGRTVRLEKPAFLELGRAIIPMSFLSEGMNLNVQFDPATGHVLITKKD